MPYGTETFREVSFYEYVASDISATLKNTLGQLGGQRGGDSVREESAYRLGGFAQYVEDDIAGSIRAAGGDFGGGRRQSFVALSNGQDVVSALCARDWKGVGSQYVQEGKVVVMRVERLP